MLKPIIELFWRLYFYKTYRISSQIILKFLDKSQFWDKEQKESYQLEELNNLLLLSQKCSPYYRCSFQCAALPLPQLSNLSDLPFVTKEIIRNNYISMKIKENELDATEHTTSGSTGDPLRVLVDNKASAFRIAGRYRFYGWWGVKPYDKNILIWARKASQNATINNGIFAKIKSKIRLNTIERTFFIDVFKLNCSTIKGYYDHAVKFNPIYLRGYLSGVVQFADLLFNAGLDPTMLNLKLIIVTSEVLHDDQREYLEAAFCCPVANEYGSAESGLFAFDCPQKKLHVFEEAVLLSSMSDGRACVTEYHNKTMPLINYINNDLVSFTESQCNCGRKLKVLSKVEGRATDYVLTAKGEKVSQYLFYYAIKELNDIGLSDCVKKYKVTQKGLIITFCIIKGRHYSEEATKYLKERVRKALGEEINIEFQFVNEIPREKGGKLRFFVQETLD